jgi:hypothetical protein
MPSMTPAGLETGESSGIVAGRGGHALEPEREVGVGRLLGLVHMFAMARLYAGAPASR